jgi:hypothetical protein
MGLEYADIVWEQIVEGGITRYLAVFHSNLPESVLPVRSARPHDVAIFAPFEGVLAYSGAQRRFIDMINDAGIQSVIMDSGHRGFTRFRGRSAPSNVLGNMESFLDQARADRQSPPPAQFVFATGSFQSSALSAGTSLDALEVRMSNAQRPGWEWNAETGTFLLSNNGNPSMSYAGTRIDAHNVVVLATYVTLRFEVPENVLIESSGPALILSDGHYIEATWSKAGPNAPIVLTDADGNDILLAQGRTWVNLMPINESWTINP